jgi:hypothetical protein
VFEGGLHGSALWVHHNLLRRNNDFGFHLKTEAYAARSEECWKSGEPQARNFWTQNAKAPLSQLPQVPLQFRLVPGRRY